MKQCRTTDGLTNWLSKLIMKLHRPSIFLAFSLVILNHASATAKITHKRVEVDGCPVAVGDRCILLNPGNGTLYDISSANPPIDPTQHLGVAVSAQVSTKSGACNQGIPLQNIKWSYTKQRCP